MSFEKHLERNNGPLGGVLDQVDDGFEERNRGFVTQRYVGRSVGR